MSSMCFLHLLFSNPCASLFFFRIQWSQFKGYFIFKLEKVMDDFRTSAPEPRGPPNPNVEYIPFEEMKERILKIVTGFNGYGSLRSNLICCVEPKIRVLLD